MKRAIVLSGGGGKGGYQIGFWKAIRKLKIDYQIVTGTSIGAINGAFMVQGNFFEVYRLWHNMNYNKVYEIDMETSGNLIKGNKAVAINYTKGALKGGLKTPGLDKLIRTHISVDKFFKSDIDYGLVTVKFPKMTPVLMTKNKIKKENLHDFLIASACPFPAFKIKNINNESYIDGGYYDNMPINLAISLGADEIIGVDLRSVGIKRKIIDKNIPIKMITPNNNIGSFLIMNKSQTRLDIKLGYNDTMKAFNMLDGKFYTFKKGSLNRNYNRINKKFYKLFDKYVTTSIIRKKYKKILGKNKKDEFNKIIEKLMKLYNMDITKIYRVSLVNLFIKKEILKSDYSIFSINDKLIKTKSKTNNLTKELVCYIYMLMKNNKKKKLNNLSIMFPDAFLCSLYIKTIIER